MTPPVFSVVIPTYNQADFLRIALQSVLNQTFEDFEIIVVNNYSTDHTLEVVAEIDDPRLQVINFKNNGVIGAGRNIGIKASKAPYVAFLDSDDTWCSNKLAEVARAIGEDPEIGLVAHLQEMVWEGPVKSSTNFGPPADFAEDVYEYLLLTGNLLATSSAVVRMECLEQVGLFSEETALITAEDYDLWLKLARVCRFRFIPEVLGANWVHLDSASSSIERHVDSVLSVLRNHLKPKKGQNPAYSTLTVRRRISEVYYYGGRLHQRAGRFKMPLSYYLKTLKSYPFNPKTFGALGILLIDRILGNYLASKFEYSVRGVKRN